MSHDTHMNESYQTHESVWAAPHYWKAVLDISRAKFGLMSHGTHMHEQIKIWMNILEYTCEWKYVQVNIHEWVMTWMSLSYLTLFEWVMAHMWYIRMSHGTHMNQAHYTYERVWATSHYHDAVVDISPAHIWMSHVTHLNESCHTFEWVMSHIWMSHVTHLNESCHRLE